VLGESLCGMGHAVAFSPCQAPKLARIHRFFSSICGRARLREATEGQREKVGLRKRAASKTHPHLNIITNQLQLTSMPVSRQQQELIKMKSFPILSYHPPVPVLPQ